MEVCHVERAAQKARREVEAKAKKEAKRQRVAEEEERKKRMMEYLQQLWEEEERKKRMMEYLQQLWDEVLEEEATLLEGAERSQVVGSKYTEVAARNEEM